MEKIDNITILLNMKKKDYQKLNEEIEYKEDINASLDRKISEKLNTLSQYDSDIASCKMHSLQHDYQAVCKQLKETQISLKQNKEKNHNAKITITTLSELLHERNMTIASLKKQLKY